MKNMHIVMVALALAVLLSFSTVSGESEKVLRVATMWDIPSIDPDDRGDAWAEKTLVTETLVKSDQNYRLLPQLALSWEQLDDDTWEIKLRDDVLFHDGGKMSADDVKFTLERGAELDSTIANFLNLDHIDVVDPATLQIHTKEPNSMLPSILHYPELGIISRNSMDNEGILRQPIGTGPFKFESFDEKTHVLTVMKNDKWWGGSTQIDRVVTIPMTDANTRSSAIEKGDVDFTVDIPYSETNRIDSLDGVNARVYNTSYLYRLDLNINHDPLSDIDVRHALSYAINRDDIVKYVLFGVGSADSVPFSSEMPWANRSVRRYDYDPNEAEELLRKAGWKDDDGDGILDKDGKPLELSLLTYATRPGLVPVAEALIGELASIGVRANLDVLEWGAIEKRRSEGDWDMVLFATNSALIPDPQYYLERSYGTGGSYNYVGYSNPRVDELLSESMATRDMEERYDLLREVQSITQEEAINLVIAHYGMVVAQRDSIKGFEFYPTAHDYRLNPEMDIED